MYNIAEVLGCASQCWRHSLDCLSILLKDFQKTYLKKVIGRLDSRQAHGDIFWMPRVRTLAASCALQWQLAGASMQCMCV